MSLSLRRPRIRIDTLAREAPKALLVDERRARPLWFDGQFLTATTFNREQTYVLTRQSDLALATGAGVVEGLQVEREGGSQTALLIRRGQGLAGNGEPLVVHEDLRIDLADIPSQRVLDRATGLAAEPGPPQPGRLPVAAGLHPACDPVLLIQAFYAFAARLAVRRGLDPDRPRHLSKVTLTR